MSIKIGNVIIKTKLVLAPMAGISNSPFRRLALKMGAGLVFAEMISDKGLFFNNQKTKDLLFIEPNESPIAQQIFGSALESMVSAAQYIDQFTSAEIIDINMGCPVPKVAIKAQAGSFLLKNPSYIYELVSKIVQSVSKPVTVKIRSGWDETAINAVAVAKEIERAGASAITVHPRTRKDGFSNKADWQIIKMVKESVAIPVIGNGDVIDGKSAQKMLDETGCDLVMIGRAALGNPFIFREINHFLNNQEILPRPSAKEVKDTILWHLFELSKQKGEKLAVLEARGVLPWYLKGFSSATSIRSSISKAKSIQEIKDLVVSYFEKLN